MPVGYEDVEPAIVVHVKKARSPLHQGIAWLADLGTQTDIVKSPCGRIAIQGIGLIGEGGYENVEQATVVIVAKIDSHIALRLSGTAESNAREGAYLCEGAVMTVVVQVVRSRVVGHEQIGPAVVVVVGPHGSQPVVPGRIVHTRFHRNLFERAVAPVVVQEIGFALHPPGTALHRHRLVDAMLALAELGKVIDIEMNITRNEQIYVSIAIVIPPRSACTEAAATHSGLFRDVFKFAVATIPVKNISSVSSHI